MAEIVACPPARGPSRKNEMKKNFAALLSDLKKEGNLILSLKGYVDALKKGEYYLIPTEGGEPLRITKKTVRAIQTAHNKRYKELTAMFADALKLKRARVGGANSLGFGREVLLDFFQNAPGFNVQDQGYAEEEDANGNKTIVSVPIGVATPTFVQGGQGYPRGLIARTFITSLFSVYARVNNIRVPNPPLSTSKAGTTSKDGPKPLKGYMQFDDYMYRVLGQPRTDLGGQSVVDLVYQMEYEKLKSHKDSLNGAALPGALFIYDNAGKVSAQFQLVDIESPTSPALYASSEGNLPKENLVGTNMYKEVVYICTDKGTKEVERFNPKLFKYSGFLMLASPMIIPQSDLSDFQKTEIATAKQPGSVVRQTLQYESGPVKALLNSWKIRDKLEEEAAKAANA